nr:hypothetical protein [Tanacetum cinerariifolium]
MSFEWPIVIEGCDTWVWEQVHMGSSGEGFGTVSVKEVYCKGCRKEGEVEDNNENLEGEEIDADKNRNTNENPLEKGHNKETKGEEIGSEEVEGNKDKCEENEGNEEEQEIYGTSDVATKKQVKVEKSKVLKEKPTVKTSSNFYDRRINISEPLSEEEKKLVECIWSDSCLEGYIVFATKGLELECLWFLSLYLEIKVDATVIDAWSDVFNHEEKYRMNLLITIMFTVGQKYKNQVNERRRIFDENVAIILENSKKKNFNNVDLNVEIDIIDNITNDVEDISERYGAYAMALIDTFINYLERHNHQSIIVIVNTNPKQVPMTWNTSNNYVYSGVFVMRHMETYLGREEF